MSTFKQKNVIKSYKLRLQEKLKAITEETENATSFLNNCVEEFRKRVQLILEIKDGKCLSLYKKLNQDFESYSEKLMILQTSFEGTEDESDSSEDQESSGSSTQPRAPSSLSSQNEDSLKISSCSKNYVNLKEHENGDLQRYTEIVNQQNHENGDLQRYAENVNLQILPENGEIQRCTVKNYSEERYDNVNMKYNCQVEDGGNITDDDFHSLNSDNLQNMNSCTAFSSQSRDCNEGNECMSSISISQSSYRSVSSNISESLAVYKENKNSHFVENYLLEIKDECSPETSKTNLVMQPNLDVMSQFSGKLTCIINPGNFWIQIENSYGYKLNFPKSEHLESLSCIKKNSYCLAPFKSKPFYNRAQSLSDGKSGNELVRVLFIDHGSTEEISVCDLRPLPESAYEIPAQAIHCYLHGIMPTEDSWSNDCIEELKYFQKNFSIDGVVKSKEAMYGVQLVVNTSAELDEDFSVDIAQSLCLDGFAVPLNESHSSDCNQQHKSQLSDPLCNKIDSSLDVSGSCDINAISNDSGVSVTSAYKSSQISHKRNEIFQKVSEDYISSVAVKHKESTLDLKPEVQIKDLIVFDSYDALNSLQNSSSEALKSANSFSCRYLCRDKTFCWHLEVNSPSLLFVEKDMVIVMLSHIVNPHEFYVNMAMENIDTLDDLREQMTNTYESENTLRKLKTNELKENMFCAGHFNDDGYWYRVKIIQINPDGEKDHVLGQYIDYGNTAVIPCSDLRPLKVDFSKHPNFAIKCTLAGVTPIESASSGDHSSYWNEEAVNCFKKLTSFERCLTAQICNGIINNQNDTFSVLLWDAKDSNDLLINAQLAEHKVAVFDYSLLNPALKNKKEVKKSLTDLDLWNPMVEEYYDPDNNYTLDDENLQLMTTGYQAKDEDYTCKYFAIHNYCPRGANCNYKHLPLLESGITHDQEEVYCLDSVPIVSETVNNLLVQVSAIITPNHFYVVLPFGCKTIDEIDDLVYKGSSYDEIINSEAKALFHDIDKHYSEAPFNENTTVALSCGTIVAAKRKWDEKWHRGRIVEVVGINHASKVFFVDSGDHEWVPRKFIRTILPKFLHTPFQAVHCNLYGIESIESEKELSWSPEAVKYFKDIVDGETLLAEIVHRFNKVFHVSLRKTSQDNHANVAQLLVSAGFAQNHNFIKSHKKETVYVPG